MEWDEELGEFLLTPRAHQIIENTKARYMGLLLPEQMKELRSRLCLTQSQMGELLQVGEKSWTRWESGKQRPSRSVNLLLRALYDGEITVEYLERARRPSHVRVWTGTYLQIQQPVERCFIRMDETVLGEYRQQATEPRCISAAANQELAKVA